MNDIYYNHMFGWGIIGFPMMILFWGAVIMIIIWAIRGSRNSNENGKSALDILKERYAKGEITKEEFESKKKDIAS